VTDVRLTAHQDGQAETMNLRTRRLRGGDAAPREARQAIRETLSEDLSEQALVDVELLVSELTTNSVRHGGCGEQDELAIEAHVDGDHVCVCLCDEGSGFDGAVPKQPDPERAGGFGLVLLDRLADRWGIQRGKQFCVWFELAV
jgi:anti-sigma regulatory factor (Ser/Thr protein kinase)